MAIKQRLQNLEKEKKAAVVDIARLMARRGKTKADEEPPMSIPELIQGLHDSAGDKMRTLFFRGQLRAELIADTATAEEKLLIENALGGTTKTSEVQAWPNLKDD